MQLPPKSQLISFCSFSSHSETETIAAGTGLADFLSNGDVIFLKGELGAGKTMMVKGIASGLNICETISSPTFSLVREYTGDLLLYHLDLYRLAQVDEAELGLEDVLGINGVCVVEWPQRLSYQPDNFLEVEMTIINDSERKMEIRGKGSHGKALARKWCDACVSD